MTTTNVKLYPVIKTSAQYKKACQLIKEARDFGSDITPRHMAKVSELIVGVHMYRVKNGLLDVKDA